MGELTRSQYLAMAKNVGPAPGAVAPKTGLGEERTLALGGGGFVPPLRISIHKQLKSSSESRRWMTASRHLPW